MPAVAALNRYAGAQGIPLISTVDAHTENDPEFQLWPPHCVAGTAGATQASPRRCSKSSDAAERSSGSVAGSLPRSCWKNNRSIVLPTSTSRHCSSAWGRSATWFTAWSLRSRVRNAVRGLLADWRAGRTGVRCGAQLKCGSRPRHSWPSSPRRAAPSLPVLVFNGL